jgi:precorrin-6A/cobalt-precorrin-6A reductase
MRILILGGTTEASQLARLVARNSLFDATLSLAGRTSSPRLQPLPTRTGGFGGTEAMSRWLADEMVEAVVDATHPYAVRISANAVAACRMANVPLGTIVRSGWREVPGDQWRSAPDADAAARALGETPRRVFLSMGRLELGSFARAPQHHYIARSIEAPDRAGLPPNIRFLLVRGPFDLAAETGLLRDEKIDVIVSKNSGGEATYPKIAAARALALPVIMIARPDKPVGHALSNAEEAMAWLAHEALRSPRGV